MRILSSTKQQSKFHLIPKKGKHNKQIDDKIKTIYGNVETVMKVEEARITTFESFCKNSWYHPTKVFPVYWSETLEKYVSVPED